MITGNESAAHTDDGALRLLRLLPLSTLWIAADPGHSDLSAKEWIDIGKPGGSWRSKWAGHPQRSAGAAPRWWRASWDQFSNRTSIRLMEHAAVDLRQ